MGRKSASGQTEKWPNTSWPRSPLAKRVAGFGNWLFQLSLRSKGGMRWLFVPRDEDAPPFITEQRGIRIIALPILVGCTETPGYVRRPPSKRQSPISPAKATCERLDAGGWVDNQL